MARISMHQEQKDFEQKLQIGKEGEINVKSFLEQNNFLVNDVTMVPYFMNLDIDLLVTDKNGYKHSVEVKTNAKNYQKNHEVFLELKRSKEGIESPGWYHRCTSDFLAWYFPLNREIYVVHKDTLTKCLLDSGEFSPERVKHSENRNPKYTGVETWYLTPSLDLPALESAIKCKAHWEEELKRWVQDRELKLY